MIAYWADLAKARRNNRHVNAVATRSNALAAQIERLLRDYGKWLFEREALLRVRRRGKFTRVAKALTRRDLETELRDLLVRYGLAQMQGAAERAGGEFVVTPKLLESVMREKEIKVVLLRRETEAQVKESLRVLLSEALRESPRPTQGEVARRIARSWFGPTRKTNPGRGTRQEGKWTADWRRREVGGPRPGEQEYLFSFDRAATIARTELAQAENQGIVQGLADAGVEEVEWAAQPDDGRSGSRRHFEMNDHPPIKLEAIVEMDESGWFTLPSGIKTPYPQWSGLPPGETINCLPEDTVVSGPRAQAAMRRWYSGDLVTLRSELGSVSATPNHPVLTTKGWVAISEVNEGDYLVYGTDDDVSRIPGLNVDGVPSPAVEVFDSLGATSQRVAGSEMNFHGDGRDSDVDVVFADSELRHRRVTSLQKLLKDELLPSADVLESLLTSSRFSGEFGVGASTSSSGFVRGLRSSLSLGERSFHGPELVGLADSAWGDACAQELLSDTSTTDTVLERQALLSLSSKVAAEQTQPVNVMTEFLRWGLRVSRVAHKTSVQWSGHVYNLQTSVGWYTCNGGIIAHNCRCFTRTAR